MSPESSSSSGEEDGDAAWRAAIDSIAANDLPSSSVKRRSRTEAISDADDEQQKSPKAERRVPKLYQLKAQKLIDEILERSLEMVRDPERVPDESQQMNDDGVRLFTKSSKGIVFNRLDHHPQRRGKPRIIPGEDFNEKSKLFKCRMRSVSVDGDSIVASARCALEKALSRSEARDSARKAATLREIERVTQLKKLRGEKWLPSLAREMQANSGRQATMVTKKRNNI